MRAFRSTGSRQLAFVAVITAALSCNPRGVQYGNPATDAAPPPTVPFDARFPVECPNVASAAAGDSAAATHRENTPSISLAGPIQHIAEFHDCQRLTRDGGRSFGPLVGVWARHRLGDLNELNFRTGTGLPVAELYNFTREPYPQLGIDPGYSCLYIRARTLTQWEGRMVSRSRVDRCPDAIPQAEWDAARRIQVTRHLDPVDAVSLPDAARWDYDERNRLHYIGVRCGLAWCEASAEGVQLSSSTWYPNRPKEHIKGWYDEQWLAVPGSNGRLVPGPRARLYPAQDLERLNEADFRCASPCTKGRAWVHVATARFTGGGDPQYVKKLNMHRGRPSQIYLRYVPTATGDRWESRIVSGPDTVYKRVLRVPHTDDVPGSTRWQWRENDERAWVRCAVGCCSVTEVDS